MKKIKEIIIIVDFVKKTIESVKVRDHCHLTAKYRGPAQNKCIINVIQALNSLVPFVFHNFSNCDSHLFFKKLVDKKNNIVKFKIVPKTIEKYVSVRYGCIRFTDSYRFFSSSLDSLVKTLVDSSHKTLKDFEKEIVDNVEILVFVKEIKN